MLLLRAQSGPWIEVASHVGECIRSRTAQYTYKVVHDVTERRGNNKSNLPLYSTASLLREIVRCQDDDLSTKNSDPRNPRV